MEKYGSDKPDLRFGMEFSDLTDLAKGHGFPVFDDAEYITGFAAPGLRNLYPQADRRPHGVRQAAADRRQGPHLDPPGGRRRREVLHRQILRARRGARHGRALRRQGRRPGSGPLRQEVQGPHAALRPASRSGPAARTARPKKFAPLWVVDFPLFEWDDETQRYYAVHHPFTSPKPEDIAYLDSDPGRVRANAYDFRLQRHGDRRRFDPYPRLETPGEDVRTVRLHTRRGAGPFRPS